MDQKTVEQTTRTEPKRKSVKSQRGVRRARTIATTSLALATMILIGVVTAACEPPPPFSLHTESKSPDGKWIADAVTTQDGGAGQPSFHTTVYLKSLTDPKVQASVLTFPDEIFKDKGKIQIAFFWFDGGLQLLMSRLPVFDTQVTRYAGMDISVTQGVFEKHIPPPAKQLEDAFKSSDVKSTRRLFLDLHCNSKTAQQVAVVRRAWHEIGSTTSTEVMQDHLIQALMAQCLIEAQPQNVTRDPDIDGATHLLKVAIQSQDTIEALTGAIGLIHVSDPRDNQSIVDLTHRIPMTTKAIRESLSYSCSPNAARTLQAMRDQAPDQATKEKIDANIKRAEPQRKENCDANH